MHVRSALPFAALALIAGALCACGKGKAPPMDNPPPPPDVAANFNQPIDAKGADGSWTLKVRGNDITLSRYAEPDVTATAPGAIIMPHEATWIAKMADSRTMTVKLYASPCSYPATTEVHGFAAEIELPGASPLSGCGDVVAAPKAAPAAPAKTKK